MNSNELHVYTRLISQVHVQYMYMDRSLFSLMSMSSLHVYVISTKLNVQCNIYYCSRNHTLPPFLVSCMNGFFYPQKEFCTNANQYKKVKDLVVLQLVIIFILNNELELVCFMLTASDTDCTVLAETDTGTLRSYCGLCPFVKGGLAEVIKWERIGFCVCMYVCMYVSMHLCTCTLHKRM